MASLKYIRPLRSKKTTNVSLKRPRSHGTWRNFSSYCFQRELSPIQESVPQQLMRHRRPEIKNIRSVLKSSDDMQLKEARKLSNALIEALGNLKGKKAQVESEHTRLRDHNSKLLKSIGANFPSKLMFKIPGPVNLSAPIDTLLKPLLQEHKSLLKKGRSSQSKKLLKGSEFEGYCYGALQLIDEELVSGDAEHLDFLAKSLKEQMQKNKESLSKAILAEQKKMSSNYTIKPYFKLLPPEYLANLTLSRLSFFFQLRPDGITSIEVCKAIGLDVYQAVNNLKLHLGFEYNFDSFAFLSTKASTLKDKDLQGLLDSFIRSKWSEEVLVRLGFFLVQVAATSTSFNIKRVTLGSQMSLEVKTLSEPYFTLEFRPQPGSSKQKPRVLCPHSAMIREMKGEIQIIDVHAEPRFNAMSCPPMPWTGPSKGGFFIQKNDFVRRARKAQRRALGAMKYNEVLVQTINDLGKIPWVLNSDIYKLALRAQEESLGLGGVGIKIIEEDKGKPPTPEKFRSQEDFKRAYYEYLLKCARINREHSSQVSKKLDVKIKLMKAAELAHLEKFWFPFNFDFRGRIYPMPAHLNHMQNDISRALLKFYTKKPLGKSGLKWLKIQSANLFGFDKSSLEDREEWIDEKCKSGILQDSAEYPIDEKDPKKKKWWCEADNPWQFLATIRELNNALKMDNPEEYMTGIALHQDGSCNGLQHYAAMGRDLYGAKQVNLIDADKPQDVYADVCRRVQNLYDYSLKSFLHYNRKNIPSTKLHQGRREGRRLVDILKYKDIEVDEKEVNRTKESERRQRREYAAYLMRGKINRAVLKQTIMTSVYGVTLVGAAEQVRNRLREINADIIEKHGKGGPSEKIVAANAQGPCDPTDTMLLTDGEVQFIGMAVARDTLDAIADSFVGATKIMDYLQETANVLGSHGESMKWVSPIGMPIEQNYSENEVKVISLRGKHLLHRVAKKNDKINRRKGCTAFPPNFVHSLDASHLLFTSKRCLEEGMPFTAVHDSYWCLPCDVNTMSRILREEFVKMHKADVVSTFKNQLEVKYPQLKHLFPEPPERGNFELDEVLKSRYFFN